AVSQVAADWGIPAEEVSLSFLAGETPEPYRSLFVEHREGFLKLTAEIEDASLENRKLATVGLANIQENLDALMGDQDTATYSPTGQRQTAPVAPRKLDRAL
ncbi:MAG: hypothetical protein ACRDKZ_08595, partial [Actinomycetota bacterium]